MIRQPYMWDEIEYLEKPVSSDERAVDAMLRSAREVVISGDASGLAPIFFDDAKVMMSRKSRIFIDKSGYIEKMAVISKSIKSMKYKDVLIRILDDDRAAVSCVLYVRFDDFRESLTNRTFDFKKRNGTWGIVRAAYY